MAGHTGRMTAEQVESRGPRFQLIAIKRDKTLLGFVISRNGESALGPRVRNSAFPLKGDSRFVRWIYAESYSLNYLVQIGRANR